MPQRLHLSIDEVRKRIVPVTPDILQVDEDDDTRFTALWLDGLRDLDYALMFFSEDIDVQRGTYEIEEMPHWIGVDFVIVDIDFERDNDPNPWNLF